MSTRTKRLVFLLGAVAAIGIALKLKHEVRVVRLPGSDVIRLEGYAFRSDSVRYDLPNRPIARGLAKVLPQAAKRPEQVGSDSARPEAKEQPRTQ